MKLMTLTLLMVFLSANFTTTAQPNRRSLQAKRPNVILIITDDQGHGDLGFHGNPKIKSPNIDRLARESTRFVNFYVSPVCAPTRASLMTGRYNYRTGVVDTYLGRAMMHPDEVTLAEMLSRAGYRTGIFGKWHLGDNYPMRPMDQGFEESLIHFGGGIGQPSDPAVPGGSSYFDPVLQRNGKQVKTKGYCSDVYTDAAINFITENRNKPFFTYLAFNAPHTPLQVPEGYIEQYKGMKLDRSEFPSTGHPLPANVDSDTTAKVYGMVTNIDDNLGRLFSKLEELRIADNTILIFMTDNGPQQPRYNSGMLRRKGSVHEGGIRVPFFVRWPGVLEGNRTVDRIAAHIDVVPTLLELCNVSKPRTVSFDGISLRPLLKGERADWPDRTLYFQWHRGEQPELYRAFAARTERYKLVQPEGANDNQKWARNFKLYDMDRDPLEFKDIAAVHPDIAERMRRDYEAWFKSVSGTRGYAPPRIHLGAQQENPVTLTRQDWRGPRAGWTPTSLGHWEVRVTKTGTYDLNLRFDPVIAASIIHFTLGGVILQHHLLPGAVEHTFKSVRLTTGLSKLEGWIARDGKTTGVNYVDVKRVD